MTERFTRSMLPSGLILWMKLSSEIVTDPGFPRDFRGGGLQLQRRAPTYYLANSLPKTGWKWKKLDGGCVPIALTHCFNWYVRCNFEWVPLLAIITLSVVQSSVQTFIHNAIMFIDTSNNDWYLQAHWIIGTPYLSIITSNVTYWKTTLWKYGFVAIINVLHLQRAIKSLGNETQQSVVQVPQRNSTTTCSDGNFSEYIRNW